MYIIVGGGGKVGYYLARELIYGGHEVLVIERDAAKSERISDELGDVVLRGDVCEAVVLDQAGCARADIFIAVTGDDEDNLVSCQVAKHRFKAPRTIARINNPKNEGVFLALGIDTTVSATSAILTQIEQRLPEHPLISLMTLKGGGLEIVEVNIPRDAVVVGRELKDVPFPPHSLVSLLVPAQGDPVVPGPTTVLNAGDGLVIVTVPEHEGKLRDILTRPAPAQAR